MITLLIGVLALLLISAALAPLDSLGWWAGWFGSRSELEDTEHHLPTAPTTTPIASSHYLVYLSGIGAIGGNVLASEEEMLLDALEEQLPHTSVIRDVFPYSVTNVGLTSQRVFGGLWRWIMRQRIINPETVLAFLINIRNLFQVAVSADQRYGPIYNFGVAKEIVRSLQRAGYPTYSGTPVTLLGWSGGGQISLGAATYLSRMIRAPLRIISLGGVLSSDPGLHTIDHLYHLYGDKDSVQQLGAILFSGRWRTSVRSPWNQALAQNKLSFICLGPIKHNGQDHYLDTEKYLADGQTYADKTISTIVSICVDAGLERPSHKTVDR